MPDQGDSPVMSGGDQVTLSDQSGAPMVAEYLRAMRVLGLADDDRCRLLAHCQSFFRGTQHDHQAYTWDNVPRDPGVGYMHERLKPQGFVPVNASMYLTSARKPDTPVPLARQIVSRFTEMLLGEGRLPSLRVESSPETQQFLEACFRESEAWEALCEARDLAGSCGAAAVAVGLANGRLVCEALNPADLWVAEWCSGTPGWVPQTVVEQYRTRKQIADPESGALVSRDYWRTRAWTATDVVYYDDVPCDDVPEGGIPIRETLPHGAGCCPVVWYQNTRDTKSPDGQPDCDGVWPLLDKLDRLQSQVYKAAIANTDPSLVIQEDPQLRKNKVIQKGSSHIIPLSLQGKAHYLEISGTSVRVGLEAVNSLASEVLQTVECVVISPEYAKAYQSGEALQILWRSMESKANRLRVTLGSTIRELAYVFLRLGAAHGIANAEAEGESSGILLPPRRVVETAEPDPVEPGEPPAPTPEPVVRWEAHTMTTPNVYVALEWPPYWTPTTDQIQKMAQALSTATGAKQIISSESAVRQLSRVLGADPDAEVRRVEAEKAAGMSRFVQSGLIAIAAEGDPDEDDEDEDSESDDGAPGDLDLDEPDEDGEGEDDDEP